MEQGIVNVEKGIEIKTVMIVFIALGFNPRKYLPFFSKGSHSGEFHPSGEEAAGKSGVFKFFIIEGIGSVIGI